MVVEKTGETEEIFKRKEEEERNAKEGKEKTDKKETSQNIDENAAMGDLGSIKEQVGQKYNEIKDKVTEKKEELTKKFNKDGDEANENESHKEKGEEMASEDKNKGEQIKDHEENDSMVKRSDIKEEEEFHTAEEKQEEKLEEKPKPSFDESKNTEHVVQKDSDKAIPAEIEEENVKKNLAENMRQGNLLVSTRAPGEPEEEMVLTQGCELEKARTEQKILFEGHAYKKMRYCFCFWVKRYFVLFKDGSLKYYRNVNGNSIEFLSTEKLEVVSKENKENDKHPYQILMTENNREKMLSFDEPDARDAWATKLSESIRSNKN